MLIVYLILLASFISFIAIKLYIKEDSYLRVFKTFEKDKRIFVFSFSRPMYFKKVINYQKADLINIFRSFYVGKIRHLRRLRSYNLRIQYFKEKIKTKEDLVIMTSIFRPGLLHSIYNEKNLED